MTHIPRQAPAHPATTPSIDRNTMTKQPFNPQLRAARFLPRTIISARTLPTLRLLTKLNRSARRPDAQVVSVDALLHRAAMARPPARHRPRTHRRRRRQRRRRSGRRADATGEGTGRDPSGPATAVLPDAGRPDHHPHRHRPAAATHLEPGQQPVRLACLPRRHRLGRQRAPAGRAGPLR